MRLFFGVLIPQACVDQVAEVQKNLQARIGPAGVKWTRPDQYHFTLKFLGEQSFQRAEAAAQLAAAVAGETEPFEAKLGAVGAFPNDKRPTTLWLGATEGAEELAALAAWLDDVLSRRGFHREKKPARAHLTLARIKSYEGEMAAARALRNSTESGSGSFRVESFALMQSILRPTGSEYSIMREFPLRNVRS